MTEEGDDGLMVSGSSVRAVSVLVSMGSGCTARAREPCRVDRRAAEDCVEIRLLVGVTWGETVLPRPSFDKIGMLESESRFFCLFGVSGSSDDRLWGTDGRRETGGVALLIDVSAYCGVVL
jgi:hypothetical protein